MKLDFVILAAGQYKSTDKDPTHVALPKGSSVLEWQVRSFNNCLPESDIWIVLGRSLPSDRLEWANIKYLYNQHWKTLGVLSSFKLALNGNDHSKLFTYGDTVYLSDTLKEFVNERESDIVVGIDTMWKKRFANRTSSDINAAETIVINDETIAEFTGAIKLSSEVCKFLRESSFTFQGEMNSLLQFLEETEFKVHYHDFAGSWAELNEPSDLANFIMGTKAETLARLKPTLKKSIICDQVTINYSDFYPKLNQTLLNKIERLPAKVIVRSSSSAEDGWEKSNAGKYRSILNIDRTNRAQLVEAIDNVFVSYENLRDEDHVLIQPFINEVEISGVVFTRDLESGAPYYVINIDDETGRTDTITSGLGSHVREIVLLRGKSINKFTKDRKLRKIISAVNEIEELLSFDKLDIEFAINKENQVFTFQVRPLAASKSWLKIDEISHFERVEEGRRDFERLRMPHHKVLGSLPVFSNMTDWNPAEMIGTYPSILASSIYRYLITDVTWALQRKEFGYRDLKGVPLMSLFCGQPYIDCRASLNSFIPHDLPASTAEKFVNAYLEYLSKNTFLHDKIESRVAFTSWVPNLRGNIEKRLGGFDLSSDDVDQLILSLKKITERSPKFIDLIENKLENLRKTRLSIIEGTSSDLDKAYHLIQSCKTSGTIAFAHAARLGFIAVAFLESFVANGVFSQDERNDFHASVLTVASEFQKDLRDSSISETQLTKKYGHLRPGTYDISRSAYWELPEKFLKRSKLMRKKEGQFEVSRLQIERLQCLLDSEEFKTDGESLFEFCKKSIQIREFAKFEFSKNISIAYDLLISHFGETYDLDRGSIKDLSIFDIFEMKMGNLHADKLKPLMELNEKDAKKK